MRQSRKLKYAQLILLLSAFFLLTGYISLAGACLYPDPVCAITPKVNSCHPSITPTVKAKTCCKSEACHETPPVARDLGGPSYRSAHDTSYPAVHDPRTPVLQCRLAIAAVPTGFSPLLKQGSGLLALIPKQSLNNLKTVVLRH